MFMGTVISRRFLAEGVSKFGRGAVYSPPYKAALSKYRNFSGTLLLLRPAPEL